MKEKIIENGMYGKGGQSFLCGTETGNDRQIRLLHCVLR